MPIYSMRDTETQEEFEVTLKYSELDQYLKDNDKIQQIFNRFPATGDSIRLGIRKPDDNFRDVLRTVRSHHKKDNINTW
jgi:NH3-dependent NAD+ synthetase